MKHHLESFWKRASRQRVTAGGLLFALAVLLVGIAAVISANNLLFLILAAMLSTLLVSDFVSRLSLAGLDLDFLLPEHVSSRRKVAGRIYVRNSKRWTPSFSVHLTGSEESFLTTLYFPVIPGRTVHDETVDVCFERRGIYRESGFQFSTSFPFGFLERRARVTLRREVLVYPCIEPQPGFEDMFAYVRGELELQFRGRGHDFYRIRPYEAFESARHVDWKATAHTGDLQIREFAREQERLLEVFLDLNVPDAETEWFEKAVDACAFLIWRVSGRSARVRFRTQEIDICMPETGDVYSILKYLATVKTTPGRPAPGPGDETALQVVFSNADPEQIQDWGWLQAQVFGPSSLAAKE